MNTVSEIPWWILLMAVMGYFLCTQVGVNRDGSLLDGVALISDGSHRDGVPTPPPPRTDKVLRPVVLCCPRLAGCHLLASAARLVGPLRAPGPRFGRSARVRAVLGLYHQWRPPDMFPVSGALGDPLRGSAGGGGSAASRRRRTEWSSLALLQRTCAVLG